MTMLINLFPAIAATNPVVAVASSSSSSKKNDNQLKFSIKDHFNDTKTVRRRGSSRTRKQQLVAPAIDESFADDSTIAVEDDSTFAPCTAAGNVATTDNENTPSLMAAATNDKKFNCTTETVTIDESSNTAAAAVPSASKMSSPNLPLYAQQQTTIVPPSILRQQTHHPVVPVSPMAYNNNNNISRMPPPPHPAYNYYNCYDYSCNYAASSTRGGGNHPDITNVDVHSSSGSTSLGAGAGGGCDYSYCSGMDSSSYCTTPSLLLTEPCEGLAKLVLRTVDTFASSVVRVMDYGEELCDSSGNNNNNNNSSSSSIGTGGSRSTMSNEYVDLLAKIERLQKMVTEKDTVFVATEKEENGVMTPSTPNGTSTTKQMMLINDLTESPITTMKEEEDETRNNHLTMNDTKTMDNPPSTINEDGVAISSSIPRSSSSSSNVPVVQMITSSQDWSVMNESLTVLNESIETDLDDFQDVVVGDDSKEQTVVGEDDSVVVNELTSSFFNNDTTMTTSNLYSKSMEVDKLTEEESKQQLVNHRSKGSSKLKKFFNPKLSVNKGDNNNKYSTLLDDQPAVDSMGFPLDDKFASPLPKGSDNALSLWGSDFNSSISSSSNLFRRVSSIGSAESSPVSVATTLESCANCGLDGKSVYQSKKKNLMICSQCQSTYYCSPECQSEDWSNGHFKTCQPFAKAAAAVNEVLL
jgi:hypothetical protein